MSSVDGSIQFLLKNIEQLQGLGKLETILPILEAMKVLMTETQFDVSMIDLTMSAENRQVARQFLVDGQTTAELQEQGISASRLSKVVARVIANFNAQLDSLELVSGQYILDSKTAQLVQEIEQAKVSEAQLKHQVGSAVRGRRKAKSNAKKVAVDTGNTDSSEKAVVEPKLIVEPK